MLDAVEQAPVDLVKSVPLFEDLDRRELESLARTFRVREVDAGDTVVSEEKPAAGFFIVAEGMAKVTVRGQDRGTLTAGDHFGEIALLDQGARTATITAQTDMRLYGLTFWEFRPLVEQNSKIAWKLLQALARMLREVEAREPVS